MSDTTTIRVTRDALNGPAARRRETLTAIVARATRLLDQESIGHDLADRAVAMTRVGARIGNVGPAVLRRIRDTVAIVIDV